VAHRAAEVQRGEVEAVGDEVGLDGDALEAAAGLEVVEAGADGTEASVVAEQRRSGGDGGRADAVGGQA
jgi:2-hydroxychromene-2-carboxylate isomerase